MNRQDLVQMDRQESLEARLKPKLDWPRLYRVCLHNDDYTPMAFVIQVLQQFFFYDEETAVSLMWEVHQKGQTSCGTYSKDIAETKVMLVNDYSMLHEHPLLCTMERVQ